MVTAEPRAPRTIEVEGRLVRFEYAVCGNCGDRREDLVLEGPDRFLGLPGRFRLVRCPSCGLIRQNPRPAPDSIDAYYPSSYEPYSRTIADEPSLARRLDRWYGMLKRRRLIESYQRGGRILDVGCATGNFLAEMVRTGRWTALGIEPNEQAAAVASEKLGLDVRPGRLEDVELPAESFDVVTMWNVLEHVHDPVSDLQRVARLLRPGGTLVFSLPNVDSYEVRVFRDRWFGWELPRHLYFFPRAVLGDILGKSGLRLAESRCLSGGQISFTLSLRYRFAPRSAPRWNQVAVALFSSPPGRIALLLPFKLLDRLRQGMILTHVAVKD